MSIYTTPLQFGYFFSLLMAIAFWWRGTKEERLSDTFLGWIMLFLGLELQDYTFGFAGINFLWEEMNGFPRGVNLLFGPAVFFYFKSQTNRTFSLQKKYFVHLVPWGTYFFIEITFFLQGPEAVKAFQVSTFAYYLDNLNYLVRLSSYFFYFYLSLSIYKNYLAWSKNQFSDTEIISFKWFRNFLYFMIIWIAFREIIGVVDGYLDLNFYQDWWWNLALAASCFYVGLQGYSQRQPQNISFNPLSKQEKEVATKSFDTTLAKRIEEIMQKDSLYLQGELSLNELSKHLKVNTRELSNCINTAFSVNFNDYINQLRIEAFGKKIKKGENQQFTLLALAYDCGFNSKATFNRAFKKQKGMSPKAYADVLEKEVAKPVANF